MIVATYYTDQRYKSFAENLRNSCKDLGLFCAVYAEKDTGSWKGNVYRKPHVVRRVMDGYPMESVLFIDADAKLKKYPIELFATDPPELACYFDGPGRPVSGTVFLQNNPRVRDFVDEWARGCDLGLNMNEDFHWMQEALKKFPHMRVKELPPSYFWKNQEMRSRFPGTVPVVEHYTIGEHSFK